MLLTLPAFRDNGIWFPRTPQGDTRADLVWSKVASQNAIRAAAATTGDDPFAKYPDWVAPYFAGQEGTLLDAGCGYGRVSIPLLKSNPGLRCVGVDASPVMLDKFVELAKEHGVDDRVELYCGNVNTLPFPDGHFQFVLSCAVLLHLPKQDAKEAIHEFRRVLVRNGTLVLAGSFPNALNPEGVVNIRHNFLAKKNGPVRVYTRPEVTQLFKDYSRVAVEAHQMIVLPRSIGSMTMPFARFSRQVNQYCSRRFMEAFKHSGWVVNHHNVTAIK
jgi:ubiquinone/menaquinone biosynthesis C-methylase UbiE